MSNIRKTINYIFLGIFFVAGFIELVLGEPEMAMLCFIMMNTFLFYNDLVRFEDRLNDIHITVQLTGPDGKPLTRQELSKTEFSAHENLDIN